VLEVRVGLFGRTLLLIGVDEITDIHPGRQRLTVADSPQLRSD
jgi:hypothetical protein